jgi:hypothetical protein
MFKPARSYHGNLRYEAGPFKGSGDRAWMVYDDRVGRLVAFPLHQHEACTLAHTLNVADLRAPAVDFGDSSGSPYPKSES